MPLRSERQKLEAPNTAAVIAAIEPRDDGTGAFARFLRRFYDHLPPDHLALRPPDELYACALSLWRFADLCPPGRVKLRVFNPRFTETGPGLPHTVIEIVTDDIPFLVESTTAALADAGYAVSLVMHPILSIERNRKGRLTRLYETEESLNGSGKRESVMHIEVSHEGDAGRLVDLAALLDRVLADVHAAVADWMPMRERVATMRQDLIDHPPAGSEVERRDVLDFLAWLEDDNFIFLGYRDYGLGANEARAQSQPAPHTANGTGLGILRDDAGGTADGWRNTPASPAELQWLLSAPGLLLLTKTTQRATIHRRAPMDAIGLKVFDASGNAVGEKVLVGLYTSRAYSRNPVTIPLVRHKVSRALERAGFDPASHDGRSFAHILETYPRDELFEINDDDLYRSALGILELQERPRIALFVRFDPFGRRVSCLVHVPRERYDTNLRRRFAVILQEAFAGTIDGFSTYHDAQSLDRVHFILRTTPGKIPAVDIRALESQLAKAGQTWSEQLAETLTQAKGADTGTALWHRYGTAFPTAYRERFAAAAAISDIERLEDLRTGAPLAVALFGVPDDAVSELRLRIYRAGSPARLSDVLPVLEHFGLKVITEVPYAILPRSAEPAWMQEFSLTFPTGRVDVTADRTRFEEAFDRVWVGAMESDGLNCLVLGARLDWRQVIIVRLYVKLLRQAGSAYSQAYIENALAANPALAAALVALFEQRFDPGRQSDRNLDPESRDQVDAIERALDSVQSLDEDRILRSLLVLIRKSLRTNHYQRDASGEPKPYLSVKLHSREIELLPQPRPMTEIFVLSPKVEGAHLRGGKVARGGIRWSDRREDFRTEILGLMKAQVVKNAVIVPTGSKGGFVIKRPPSLQGPAAREALLAEAIECYKTLLRGLLDLTDNIIGTAIVPPPDVVRHDGDDPYLVVAADKGTASFSDIANGISADYDFWLGDAFASGGSAGYDHKAMGITARGAWETVTRHFHERGIDIATTDFTIVGVGDMSGDVFGNGMLLSRHIKLVAAFDHRDIFLDPTPDPASSFAERQRLFALPRSSWADYDRGRISPGGGVFARDSKAIPLSPEIRRLFAIAAEYLTPAELIQSLLTAPVDLLWFGGIGTYVKAAAERHGDVGDRANDSVRVDAEALQAAIVGEGANLGVTQRGRVAFALSGGRINTDAIDNSAGVDASDHEVNIKILLDTVVASGELTVAARNLLLQEMTEVVAELVLADNRLQGLALSLAESRATTGADEQIGVVHALERSGALNRAVEFLPDDETLIARAAVGQGFTRPELAVIMAYVKNGLVEELLSSDLPDDPQMEADLVAYFPPVLRKRFPDAIREHRLRREIIATVAANDLVNRGGITLAFELGERTGRPASDVARSFAIVRRIFALDALWESIESVGRDVPAAAQMGLWRAPSTLIARNCEWLLRQGVSLDIHAQTEIFRRDVAILADRIAEILPPVPCAILTDRIAALTASDVPETIAVQAARLEFLVPAVDIVRLGLGSERDIVDIGRCFFAIGTRFRLDALRLAAAKIAATTAWQKLAISGLLEDLYAVQLGLAGKAIDAGEAFDSWIGARATGRARLDRLIDEAEATPAPDLAMLVMATRGLTDLVASTAAVSGS